MNKQFSEILQRRMDRKDFLKHVGMGVVVLTGLAGVVKLLKPQDQANGGGAGKVVGSTYGASVYGGRQESSVKS